MMKAVVILTAMALGAAAPALAANHIGRLMETPPPGGGGFICFTDSNGNVIPGSCTFGNAPFVVDVPQAFNGTDVDDFVNGSSRLTGNGGPGGGGGGAFNWLWGESLIFNLITGRWEYENLFTRLYEQIGDTGHLIIPDMFGDINNDGVLDDLDIMYSWIDINACGGVLPAFSLGDSFNVVDGKIAGYECMWFSPTPIFLDPVNGPRPTGGNWFTGVTTVYATHDGMAFIPPMVPEPDTWALMIAGFAVAGTALRRRKAQLIA
jgi:hypothetical protein